MRSRKKYALIAAACVVVIGAALLIYGALADGTVTEVTAFNPFLIIDGTAYKTKYAPVVVASCISFASSSQAAYPSLPAEAESSVISLLILSQ